MNTRKFFRAAGSLVIAMLVVPATVSAVDGVYEINQACVDTGCFPGDSAGFPVEITTEGSYRLTSDLDVSNVATPENQTAVTIDAPGKEGVTLDLNGFRIVGPTACPGLPPTNCTPNGTGTGIYAFDNKVTIRNGRILGMGGHAIWLVTAGRVEGMLISNCGGDGIQCGEASIVRNNIVQANAGIGIKTGSRGLVLENLVHANIGMGMDLGVATGYGGNVVNENTGGTVDGAFAVQMGDNVCDGNLCP